MCGILGIYKKDRSYCANELYNKFCLLQHRGQDSAGIITTDDKKFYAIKGCGMISQIFNEKNLMCLQGYIGLAHNRYSTMGESNSIYSIQPIEVDLLDQKIYFAQNGTITNCNKFREYVNIMSENQSDSEIIKNLIIKYYAETRSLDKTLIKLMNEIPGAYSLIVIAQGIMYGLRDRYGIRPLVLGNKSNSYVFSSESCVFNTNKFHDVSPGEIIKIDQNGENVIYKHFNTISKFCVFEQIYFSRPDSLINNNEVYNFRVLLGKKLAQEDTNISKNIDYIVPVPNSSIPHSIGYSQQSGIPLCYALIRNTNAGRTFILPDDKSRKERIKIKFTALPFSIKNKNIILIDDSIVRGNTIAFLVKFLHKHGANEVHVRITSPPIKYPCYMGIDMSTSKELIANHKSITEIKKIIGADSLQYLSQDGLASVCNSKNYCTACFTGDYPIEINDW